MLLSIKDLFEKSADLYKKHLKFLGQYVWIISIPAFLLSIIEPDSGLVRIPGDFLNILVSLSLSVVLIWMMAALVRSTAALIQNKPTKPVKEELKGATHKILPVFLASLLSSAAVLGGMIFFIIPGIIFVIWFTFITQEIVLNNVSATGSLSASKHLVEGRWWPVFWRVVAPGFAFAVLVVLTKLVFSTLFIPLRSITIDSAGSFYFFSTLTAVVDTVISVAFIPWITLVSTMVFLDLSAKPVKKQS